jgi:hypothetical protein
MKYLLILPLILISGLMAGQTRSASNCSFTNNYPTDCTGNNITEDFNTDNGGFTSNEFKWDSRKGNWKAVRIKSAQYLYITSGTYQLLQAGTTNFGFVSEGGGTKDIQILDASTGEILTECAAVVGAYPTQSQICQKLPLETGAENLTVGRLIKYRVKYFVRTQAAFILPTFDNFSVGGSAVRVTSSNSQSINVAKEKIFSPGTGTKLNSSVYPNPAGQQTIISYEPFENGKTTIDIYDLNGIKLKTLDFGNSFKGQIYEKQIDLSAFRSGSYFYRLTIGKNISKGSFIKTN